MSKYISLLLYRKPVFLHGMGEENGAGAEVGSLVNGIYGAFNRQ